MSLAQRFFALSFILLSIATTRPASGCNNVPLAINATHRSEPITNDVDPWEDDVLIGPRPPGIVAVAALTQ
ncbi:MAG: hypothetical protein ABJC13_08125 [Acidobacteriota bacterium]